MKNHRRQFSVEFKQETIALVRRTGKSAHQIANELGVNQTSLSRWVREADSSRTDENVFATHAELSDVGSKAWTPATLI